MLAPEPPIPHRRVKRGLLLFIGLSVIGVVFLVQRSTLDATIDHLREFDLRWLAVAAVLFNLDWVMSATRIWTFARKVQSDISFRGCARSCFVNVFVGGATPSQTGGGPAQIWVMYREGLSLVDSTVVCFVGGFLGTAVVLMTCGVTFSVFFRPEFAHGRFALLSGVSLILFSLVVAIVLLSVLSPGRFRSVITWMARRVPGLQRVLSRGDRMERMIETTTRYNQLMTGFVLRAKLRLTVVVILSAVIYFNKFMVAWVVLRGLGFEAPFWDVMYMQVVLMLIFYFSPTPGASGVAEVSTVAIMQSVVPVTHQAAFILLWRFFTLVAGMSVGAVVLLWYLYRAPTAVRTARS